MKHARRALRGAIAATLILAAGAVWAMTVPVAANRLAAATRAAWQRKVRNRDMDMGNRTGAATGRVAAGKESGRDGGGLQMTQHDLPQQRQLSVKEVADAGNNGDRK